MSSLARWRADFTCLWGVSRESEGGGKVWDEVVGAGLYLCSGYLHSNVLCWTALLRLLW